MKAPKIEIPETLDASKERSYNLPSAPVLRPSVKDWADPLTYISKISLEMQKFGICKIIPPKSWSPDFSIDSSAFWFKTRIQNLSCLHGLNRGSKNYLLNLIKFHSQSGDSTNLARPPIVEKRPLDLLLLRNIVEELGGYEVVAKEKKWKVVAREMGYSNQGWVSKAIGIQYEKWIKPFQEFTQNDVADTTKAVEFSGIPKFSSREMVKAIPIIKKKQDMVLDNLQGVCSICTKGHDEDKLLLCDGCNKGFHLYCLEPKLEFVPYSDWYCAKCLKEIDSNFGFDDGKIRCLYEFQYISNKFKKDWFFKKMKSFKISSQDVEDEFWRLVHSPFQDVEVEYGADLHSSLHGSGFPTLEKVPENKYSKCPWNLNNLPILSKSVFRHIKSDISGMIVPWLYVGMIFSAFCWHTEDHYTYSINYLHWGEPKTWYGIPSSDADKFEDVMKQLMPDLFKANPDLLFHLTTIVSPWELRKHDISVCTIDQNPGEFVITFPRGYHAGFNQGFNFAEAVNFALPDWFGFGRECIERYREYCKNPVFCHDELLFATAHTELDPESAKWLSSDLAFIIQKTINDRLALTEKYGPILTIENIEYRNNDNRQIPQCFKCHAFCFINVIFCKCESGRVSCESHIDEVIECFCKSLTLQMRFSEKDLINLQLKVDLIANIPVKWSEQLMKLLIENEKPEINELKRLMDLADSSGEFQEEMVDLQLFINEANSWAESVNRIFQKRNEVRNSETGAHSRVERIFGSERTLAHYYMLLDKAYRMSFDCPELTLLKDAIESAEHFRGKVKALLKDDSCSLGDLNELYNNGLTLETGTEELFDLEVKIHTVQWEEKASALLYQENGDIKPFTELIKSGLELGIYQDHPQMVSLKKIKSNAEKWRDEAHDIMRLSTLNICSLFEIEKLLLVSKTNHHYKATLNQLEKLHGSIKIWYDKAVEIFDNDDAGNINIRNIKSRSYDSVKELLMNAESLCIKLEIPEVLDLMKISESWLQKGKKVLGRSKSSKTFKILLTDLQNNVKVFTKADDPKHLICFCKKESEGQTMIKCIKCNHSYHTPCLKITKKMMRTITDFICFVCCGEFDAIKEYQKLPSLVELQEYVYEGRLLCLIPQEVHDLENIVGMLRDFKKYIFEFLTKDDSKDINALQKLIRHTAGLDVLIEPELSQLRKRVASVPSLFQDVNKNESEGSGTRYCICREIYTADKPMIGCDQCSEWYHWECLGLSAKNVEAMRDAGFICTICSSEVNDLPELDSSKTLSYSASHKKCESGNASKNQSSCLVVMDKNKALENVESLNDDDLPVKVTKKFKSSNICSKTHRNKENMFFTSQMQQEHMSLDIYGADDLLPPPPLPWPTVPINNDPEPALQESSTFHSFLYSPFAVVANNIPLEFLNEEIGLE